MGQKVILGKASFFIHKETFAREMILVPGKAKMRAKREFTVVNDRLSTFLTQHGAKMAFVQGSLKTEQKPGQIISIRL